MGTRSVLNLVTLDNPNNQRPAILRALDDQKLTLPLNMQPMPPTTPTD